MMVMTADAFAADVYARHAPAVMRLALRLAGGDRQQAEDITQETMLRAWQHRGSLDARRARAWLCQVARNYVTDMHRRRWREVMEGYDGEVATLLPAVPDDTAGVDARLTVLPALERLSLAKRAVIIEVYYRGRSVAETAEILGIPSSTAKSRANDALKALREALGGAA